MPVRKPDRKRVKKRMEQGKVDRESGASFIYVGRLERLKGIELLLQAWTELQEFPLLLCGSGSLKDWCCAYKSLHGLDHVTLAGQLEREHVRALMGKATALILPTLWYEGFPMTILEAYSVGTPVIAPDLGNAGDLVREGITGRHYKPMDVPSLRRTVYRTCQEAGKLRESTLSFGQTHFSEMENYHILMKIYGQAVGNE